MYSNKLVASIKTNGQIAREHGDIVYLPFGSDYTIFLKNLHTKKAVINISIDGKDILDGTQLILDGGMALDLKRWIQKGDMTTGPKLRFIEKTDTIRETKEETGMDGIIEVTYQFEYEWPQWNFDNTLYRSASPSIGKGGNQVYGGFKGGNLMNMNVGGSIGSSLDGNVQTYSSQVKSLDGSLSAAPQVEQEILCSASIANEEGMTVKGQDIEQEFKEVCVPFLDATVHKIVLCLKGDVNQKKVAKAITVKTKINCDACDKKQSSKNKFCVSCGNNLKYSK